MTEPELRKPRRARRRALDFAGHFAIELQQAMDDQVTYDQARLAEAMGLCQKFAPQPCGGSLEWIVKNDGTRECCVCHGDLLALVRAAFSIIESYKEMECQPPLSNGFTTS